MERINENYIKGEPIKNIEELIKLAENKKAVYHENWRIKPAAFIIFMQTRLVYNMVIKESFFNIIKNKEEFISNIE